MDESQFDSVNNYKSKAFKLCQNYLQGSWMSINEGDFKITRITGGLSNHMFLCSLPEGTSPLYNEPAKVLLRIYGKNNSDVNEETLRQEFNNSIKDNLVFTIMSERELGPILYGVFPEGRLEEFIPSRQLTHAELRSTEFSQIVAPKLAKIHDLNIPINKEHPCLWLYIDKYLNQVAGMKFNKVEQENRAIAAKLLNFDYEKEIKWLRNTLDKVQSPIVFCHNDLQAGNILLRHSNALSNNLENLNESESKTISSNRIVFIDYEFSGYNYRAFDLANHFCEYIYDYTNQDYPFYKKNWNVFPNKDKMLNFFRHYVMGMSNPPKVNMYDALKDRRENRRVMIQDKQAEILLKEVQPFFMAPNLLWCLWAIIQSTNNIPFGYWNYANDRMEDYMHFKEMVLATNSEN